MFLHLISMMNPFCYYQINNVPNLFLQHENQIGYFFYYEPILLWCVLKNIKKNLLHFWFNNCRKENLEN